MNRTTATQYNAAGLVTAEITPLGTTTTLYDSDGEATSVTDPLNRTTTTQYSSAGLATTEITPLGTTTTIYDNDGEGTTVIDPLNRTTTTQYNPAGRATAEITVLGTTTTLYDNDGEVTSVSDPMNRTTTTQYSSAGLTTAEITPLGTTTTLYDNDGEATSVTDPLNRTTTTQYSLGGLATTEITPLGTTTTAYDSDGEATSVTDPLNRVTTSLYNLAGLATAEITPLGTTTTLYDNDGEVTSFTDPLIRTTTTQYSSAGLATTEITPLGTTTTAYDSDGEVVSVTDPMNRATSSQYNTAGLVTAEITALGTTTTLYDGDGEATSVTDPMNRTTTTQYSSAGLATASITALGTTTTLYDSDGEATSVTDPMNRTTTTQYSSAGLATASITAAGTATTLYDDDGEVTTAVDPDGNTTTTLYNTDGLETTVIDPRSNVTTFAYDSDGELTQQVTPIGTTTMSYNSDGEKTAVIDADGRLTMFLYDADGEETGETWYAGSTTMTTVTNVVTFGYDSDGRETLAADSSGTYTMLYDADGEVTAVAEPFGVSLTMAYNAGGERTLVADSFGGVQTSTYDADGELTSIAYTGQGQAALADLTYYSDGSLDTIARYSDLGGTNLVATTTYSIDAASDVTAIADVNGIGTTLTQFDYTYDNSDRLQTETDYGGTATTYGYDPAGQVTAVTGPLAGASGSYSYDASGNTAAAGSTIVADNELKFDGTWTYTYDAEGNETGKVDGATSWAYAYDNKNEMTSAVETMSGTPQVEVDYEYDAFGNRIQQVVTTYTMGSPNTPPTTTNYAVDGWLPSRAGATGLTNFSVWADLDSVDNLQSRYLVGDEVDQLIARVDRNTATAPALAFGGDTGSSNGGVNLTQTNLTNANVTISVWVKLDAFGGTFFENASGSGTGGVLLGSNSGTGTVKFDVGNPGGSTSQTLNSSTALTLGEWYLVSATYDGSVMKIYINGVLDSSISYSGGIDYASATASIGYDRSGSGDFVNGQLTDVRVYSSAVNLAGIQEIYNNGKLLTVFGGNGGTLVGWWRLNFGSGTSAADSSGSGNTGTLVAVSSSPGPVWVSSGGGTVQMVAPTYWYLTDRQGSVRYVIDDSAAVLDHVDYDAFGNILSGTDTDPSARAEYAYTGREYNVETELQYNRARYYDPATQRWMSQDPLGFDAGDSNLYRYVNNRPTNATDPSGKELVVFGDNGLDGIRTFFKAQTGGKVELNALKLPSNNKYAKYGDQYYVYPTPAQYDILRTLVIAPNNRFYLPYLGLMSWYRNVWSWLNGNEGLASEEFDPYTKLFASQRSAILRVNKSHYGEKEALNGIVDDFSSGKWSIDRNGGATAIAVSGPKCTFKGLADQIGLDIKDKSEWLTIPTALPAMRPGGRIEFPIAQNNQLGESLANFASNESLPPGQVVKVPNTVYALWCGDCGEAGMLLTGWNPDIRELKSFGFNVVEQTSAETGLWWGVINLKDAPKTPDDVYNKFGELTGSKELQGFVYSGHGNETEIGLSQLSGSIFYSKIVSRLKYKLGFAIINACDSDPGGRVIISQSPWALFRGDTGELVPVLHTSHPHDLFSSGQQGTNVPLGGF